MRGVLAVGIVFLLALPTAASAQERRGLWGRFAGGGGRTNVSTGQSGAEGFQSGFVGSFSGGWTLRDQWLIGAEFDLWTKTLTIETADVAANVGSLFGTLTWYPKPTSHFFPIFLRGGGGVSVRDADFSDGTTVDLGKGPGVIAGAGIDFPVGRIVSWALAVDFWHGRFGPVKRIDIFASEHQNVIAVTFGLTIH